MTGKNCLPVSRLRRNHRSKRAAPTVEKRLNYTQKYSHTSNTDDMYRISLPCMACWTTRRRSHLLADVSDAGLQEIRSQHEGGTPLQVGGSKNDPAWLVLSLPADEGRLNNCSKHEHEDVLNLDRWYQAWFPDVRTEPNLGTPAERCN